MILKNKYIIIGIFFMVIALVASVNAEATRVAVIGFESEAEDWTDSREREIELLEEIAWQFNDKLAEEDDYAVLDRDRMLDILDENGFYQGQRPVHSIVNQLRNQINADLFAYGILKDVNIEETDRIKIGPIRYSEVEVTLDLSLDMIDPDSAEVENTYSGRGEADESEVEFDEGDGISVLSEDILHEAIENAVDDLVGNIIEDSPAPAPAEKTVEAEITAIVGERLVINKGEEDGLKVGQSGEIVRAENSSLQSIGEIEVTEVDSDSAFLGTTLLDQEPETGDRVLISFEEETEDDWSSRGPIEVLDTRDFKIEIEEAEKFNERVTISGTVHARRDDAELELILGTRYFYDHEGNRRNMSGREVTIGDWTNSSSEVASLSGTISRDESRYISWSFTEIPEEAESLARVELGLKTPQEGEMTIELRDLEL